MNWRNEHQTMRKGLRVCVREKERKDLTKNCVNSQHTTTHFFIIESLFFSFIFCLSFYFLSISIFMFFLCVLKTPERYLVAQFIVSSDNIQCETITFLFCYRIKLLLVANIKSASLFRHRWIDVVIGNQSSRESCLNDVNIVDEEQLRFNSKRKCLPLTLLILHLSAITHFLFQLKIDHFGRASWIWDDFCIYYKIDSPEFD